MPPKPSRIMITWTPLGRNERPEDVSRPVDPEEESGLDGPGTLEGSVRGMQCPIDQ